MNKFDRIGDWKKFSKRMEEYITAGPQEKYGSKLKFNDLSHYTGLRVMVWNMLKYALRLWNCSGKVNDFEKAAHYSQMAWTLKERQGRKLPFFKEDTEGDYVIPDRQDLIKEKEDLKVKNVKTNSRFDGLTNLDIVTYYSDKDYYLIKQDFLAAFTYWVVFQSSYNTPDITEPLMAFDKYVGEKVPDEAVIKFSFKELRAFINEGVFEKIPAIKKLSHAKIEIKGFIASSSRYHETNSDYDYIDLGALARNVFFMILRECITRRMDL